jgi:hypothetical protein
VAATGNAIIEALLLTAKSFSRDGRGMARIFDADCLWATSSIHRVAGNCIRNRHLVDHEPCLFRDVGEDPPHFTPLFTVAICATAVGGAAEAWQRRNRTISDPQDLTKGNLVSGPQQRIAARSPCAALHGPSRLRSRRICSRNLCGMRYGLAMSPIMAEPSMRASATRALSAYFARGQIMAYSWRRILDQVTGIFNSKRCCRQLACRLETGEFE